LVRVAISIVSYNVQSLLRGCPHSIEKHAGGAGYTVETIVVDNASSDGSAAMVAAEFPAVRLLASAANLGFTGGNNLALRMLGFPVSVPAAGGAVARSAEPPDYVLLLNPDAELTPGALPQLVDYLATHPAAAICGPQLRYGDGRFQHGAFLFPGLGQVALDVLPVAGLPAVHRLLDSRINGRYPATLWQGGTAFPVDFVLGAAMLVRGAAIAQVGGLDDGYWMYCEEMDWCLRMREEGWQVAAVPAAVVVHHEGQSSRQRRWRAFEQLWRSRYRFYTQHRDRFPTGLRSLVRLGMTLQARQARADFAAGRVTGSELADALAAFAAVARL
jgi:GT2 family glycosyltransferase